MKNSIAIAALTLTLFSVPILARSELSPQSYEAGHKLQRDQMPAGYNHPGGINTVGWNVFVNGSFLYWRSSQDGMTLAIPQANPAVGFSDTIIYQDFNYKSGFKIAAGFKAEEYDDWGGKVEYTRLHGTHSNHAVAPNLGTGFLNMEPWINDVQGNGVRADSFGSKWSIDLDVIDVGLFRTYYVGRHLVFQTFFGGRGGWLDQSLSFDVQIPTNPLPNPGRSTTTSDSWFLGTKGSIDTNWILGYGLRLVGNAEISFFFQRYKLRHTETEVDNITENGVNANLTVRFLRPTLGLQLGMGWGTYLGNQTAHIDFEATYDLMTWWAQNMLRMLADITNITRSGNEGQPGNLYYQGLTLRGQLHF